MMHANTNVHIPHSFNLHSRRYFIMRFMCLFTDDASVADAARRCATVTGLRANFIESITALFMITCVVTFDHYTIFMHCRPMINNKKTFLSLRAYR